MIPVPILMWGVLLAGALAALAWIDIRTLRLPDMLTLPLIMCGLLFAWAETLAIRDSLIGAVAGYLFFFAVEKAFLHLRGKEGLGRGDAKLLAAGGAWCGWMGVPLIVLIASSAGLLAAVAYLVTVRKRVEAIPFGPFIAVGIAAVWAWQTWSRLAIG